MRGWRLLNALLEKAEFDYVNAADKAFIIAFDTEMKELGYTSGASIGPGYCWGKHMIIYTKAAVKSKKSYARIYIRDEDMVLRLYLSDIDKHRDDIEQAPAYIQEAFIGNFPSCDHCEGKTQCIHQKRYTICSHPYEICDGKAFWFVAPKEEQLPAYLQLFSAFYPQKKRRS